MTDCLCRFCSTPLSRTFADLGMSPIANAFLSEDQLNRMEPFYPLRAYVCQACFLVQLEDFQAAEHIFNDHYAYFSSYSESWLKHAEQYTEAITARLGLNQDSFVVEIASNDGYLLQYFMRKGIPVLGIEPSGNVANAAKAKGIETLIEFLTTRSAREVVSKRGRADLVLGNNVLAHVPALNDFVEGLKILLSEDGVLTMEFPHLLRLIEENQFDTIYHEHFSYFSLLVAKRIFARHGLRIFDVDQLPTHGGSLRVYAAHEASFRWKEQPAVAEVLADERSAGIDNISSYSNFSKQVKKTKLDLLRFLIDIKHRGNKIVGYGAPAKGNTLLNFCGIGSDFLDYTVDRSPQKQGMFLPGTHIPIAAPDEIFKTKPDYVLILPWNLRDEVAEQMSGISAWGGKFIVPIPEVRIMD